MPFFIVKTDLTKMKVDAIVNATDNNFSGGGGIDYAIHNAAGESLKEECAILHDCKTGDAKITNAYNLPFKKIIHTVGPIWQGGQFGEEILLKSCYTKSLELAKENKLKSIAFPLISSGVFGYPKDQALKVAVDTIKEFITQEDMSVYLAIYSKDPFILPKNLFDDISEYLVSNYDSLPLSHARKMAKRSKPSIDDYFIETDNTSPLLDDTEFSSPIFIPNELAKSMLAGTTQNLDESFSEMLFRLIDEKGITDVECYKRANIDRKLFSKIRSAKDYRPSKTTAVAFAIALELPFDKAKTLIEYAGYSLTHNNKFDVIIEYFIKKGVYDIFTINEALFEFDQKLLGN